MYKLLGNDVGCPWVSQYDFWRELYYFHKYIGVSNRFALYTATSLASKYAGLENITGSIDVGKDADMVICDGSILDPQTTVYHTIIDGEIVYSKA